jgi:sugar lactone lactonase YvrE
MRALAPVLVAACLVAGCANQPTAMRWNPGNGEYGSEGRVWPAPQTQEVPRYRYLGMLTGEANFRTPEERKSGWVRAWEVIAGLAMRSEPPSVLQRPLCVTVDPRGRILVGDVSRGAVFVFDEPGGRLQVWDVAAPGVRFITPAGIATSADEIWVADADQGRVFRLNPSGNPIAEVGAGLLKRPTGVARDAGGGRWFVADAGEHDIKVFDDGGRLLERWGRKGDEAGEFNAPTHLTYAQDRLYVSDSLNARVQAFDRLGQPLATFGQRGLYVGNMVRPKGVAADDEGNVYVVESMYDTLLVFDAQARLLLSLGGTGLDVGRFYLPAGVWVDQRNRVFVADMFNGRVVVFQFLGGG